MEPVLTNILSSISIPFQKIGFIPRAKDVILFSLILGFTHLLHFKGAVVVGDVDVIAEVSLEQGKLFGATRNTREGQQYYRFLGIPYGKANRFEPSKPHGGWSGILDATNYGAKCAHTTYGPLSDLSGIFGEEDCLFLNVYVPKSGLQNNGNFLPVIVFIHGGGFSLGAADDYDPVYFMDEDVVFVTMNYRLAAFGFLSTGDDGLVEGNLGLKDQVLSLKWIQKNIEKFGGDVNRVTITGQSAGGGSVSFLLLSPLTKGLFSSAIMASGSAFCPWALNYKPEETAKALSKAVGCPTGNNRIMVDCLKSKSVAEITEPQKEVKWFMEYKYPFFPSVEFQRQKPGHDILLPDYPVNLGRRGEFQKVPLIIGLTDDEGLVISNFVADDEDMLADLSKNWTSLAPMAFYYDIYPVSEERLKLASDKVRQFYFGSRAFGNLANLTNIISDFMFQYGVQKAAMFHAKHAPTYAYLFSYREHSALLAQGAAGDVPVVSHGSDIRYLLRMPYLSELDTEESATLSKDLVHLWATFAATGEPEGGTWGSERKWERLNPKEMPSKGGVDFYQISPETKLLKKPFKSRFQFLDYLLKHELKFP